jgi:hypothetical protein
MIYSVSPMACQDDQFLTNALLSFAYHPTFNTAKSRYTVRHETARTEIYVCEGELSL